jgi:hypothetical protein
MYKTHTHTTNAHGREKSASNREQMHRAKKQCLRQEKKTAAKKNACGKYVRKTFTNHISNNQNMPTPTHNTPNT